MSRETELKPCPFCGGKAELHYQPVITDKGVCVRCTECRARSKFFYCDCNYTFYHGEKKCLYIKGTSNKRCNKCVEQESRQ